MPRTKENAMLFMYGLDRLDISKKTSLEQDRTDYSSPFSERLPQIWADFQAAGFITGFASNTCESNVFWSDKFNQQYLVNNPPDHEGISISCDPHYHDYIMGADQWQGPYCNFRRCVYKKDSFEYTMSYAKAFWSAYQGDRKVFMLNFIDMHEGTHEVINYLDRPLARFLKDLEQ